MESINLDFMLFRQAGPLIWPILLLGIFGLLIFVERVLYLHKGQIRTDVFLSGMRNLLEKGRLVEALTVCEETPGPVAAVVKAALLNHDQGEARMRGFIQGSALVQIAAIERRIGTLAAIARVAPVMGLLGTVVAMIEALFGAKLGGAYPNMSTVSGSFAEALLTTAFGLAIAVLSHLAYHFLSGRVRALVNDMEYAGHEMMMALLVEGHANASAPSSVEKEGETK
ncbi:MAG: MotA/TolQ/ExbB proton channel family protein [Opitutales bacterium]|nr:MotA/TolQ/ExbB proton channel family protein [Opitutales bacterium]